MHRHARPALSRLPSPASRVPAARLSRRQRGAAVVTALLIVALAVVVVSGMLWRQQVQIRSIENQRLVAQAAWIERAAVDWSRLILRDDQRRSRVDYLGEPWSVPVAETRLSDFLGAGVSTDQSGETSFVSGRILDAQARFNLTNLYAWQADGAGRAANIDVQWQTAYRRLLQTLGLDAGLAEPTAQYFLRAARGVPTNGQPAPRPPDSADDLLAIPGYTPAMVAVLEPFVTVLPERTAVNANTADAEVLSAVIDKLPVDRARTGAPARPLVFQQRRRSHFAAAEHRAPGVGNAQFARCADPLFPDLWIGPARPRATPQGVAGEARRCARQWQHHADPLDARYRRNAGTTLKNRGTASRCRLDRVSDKRSHRIGCDAY